MDFSIDSRRACRCRFPFLSINNNLRLHHFEIQHLISNRINCIVSHFHEVYVSELLRLSVHIGCDARKAALNAHDYSQSAVIPNFVDIHCVRSLSLCEHAVAFAYVLNAQHCNDGVCFAERFAKINRFETRDSVQGENNTKKNSSLFPCDHISKWKCLTKCNTNLKLHSATAT